ncbi:MAG TPA: DNA methyltransferase [bacterium]|nr:DNA methyltransferase [bacterium]
MRRLDRDRVRGYLRDFAFKSLFIDELGWDHYTKEFSLTVDGETCNLRSIAEKRGMVAFVCSPSSGGVIPEYAIRRKIDNRIRKLYHEHFIIYTDAEKTVQVWQWVKREAGKPAASREHRFYLGQSGEPLIQKLQAITFAIEEEDGLTIVDSSGRVRAAFDTKPVTRRFYDGFKRKRDEFHSFLDGIPTNDMQRWYVSVMLNRLMFIYFIQSKGFLDDDRNYLVTKLKESKRRGKDRYYRDFLCPLFFEGFAKREQDRSPEAREMLGKVPFLNGGLFMRHEIEEKHGREIEIADAAFEKLFGFFDEWRWHLDERPLRNDKEINPDILGYVYEKYINQKQMGAYYTKEDITGYISRNTVIPFLFDAAKKDCKIAFEGDSSVWRLLKDDPDRYIYNAMLKGVDLPLPERIAMGVDDVSKRTYWNKAADEEYKLPTEIWRETVARRQRCEEVRAKLRNGEVREINDLITLNLNIEQFAEDVVDSCEGPELLRAFWKAINGVSVLDPACGSGAFLFAALNILECLYEACLNRMRAFVDELDASGEKHSPEKYSDFRKVLARIGKHPNEKYFIFKSIVLNNLYGVDIMDEAVEICKLRLFLKLVSQVENPEDIEPLPDIDFNIRAGNSLVGFAKYEDVERAVKSQLDFGNVMERIERDATEIGEILQLFRLQQTDKGGTVTLKDKQEVTDLLKKLEGELNTYLADQYGVRVSDQTAYELWRDSHKPFHWFIEFHEIMNRAGFDVIIGNPPYVEYSKVKNEYTIKGYQTEKCGNLYVFMAERSSELGRQRHGNLGIILPISLASTPRMLPLRELFSSHDRCTWCSNYADRPGSLFTGVHQKLSIILATSGQDQSGGVLHTTAYQHWYGRSERAQEDLMHNLAYVDPHPLSYCWAKSGDGIEVSVFEKIQRQLKPITDCITGDEVFSLNMRMMYWGKAFDITQDSREYKHFGAADSSLKKVLVAVFNSSLYFWFWELVSDGWHITQKEMVNFLFDPGLLTASTRGRLDELTEALMSDLTRNRRHVGTKQTEYEYYHRLSKPIIDEIDRVLARHYGFTDEELDFIINYDIKYRMGWGAGGEPARKDEG